jgi:hypothetical protein
MKTIHFNFIPLLLVSLSVGLFGCNLNTALQSPTQDLLATSVHQTTSALLLQEGQTISPTEISVADPTATPENEPQPTETLPPTPNPEPTETPVLEDNRILFAPGTTFATVRGEVMENAPKDYILQISQGQMLSLFIESEDNPPVLGLSGADGKEILSASNGYVWFFTTIQKTQDYIVTIVPADKHAKFILHVATPISVEFDAGTTSKTFQGMINPDDMVEFRAYALKGQKASVTLSSISGQASLHIYGLSDLENYVERKSGATSWEATLPESQNYIIKVLANQQATEFTLKIEFLNP